MNQELWNKIVHFDFDSPPTEYGFSTRLANENFWTKDFTVQTILEYKKFMYLAATSDLMVSPSEIIDIVWHQHLIFTQSYQDFCTLIGKQVQHIPSTHNKEDFQKFKQAKERTKKLYAAHFGEQPKCIWEYSSMYESLNLAKSKYKIRTLVIFGILSFVVLTTPFYFLLRPYYITIDNPDFLGWFIGLILITFIALEIFNDRQLRGIANQFDKDSFIYKLQPFEVIYLQNMKMSDVINCEINELIENKTITVNPDNRIAYVKGDNATSIEHLQTIAVLNELGNPFYPNLLQNLVTKPIFWNTANCMDAFRKYFNKSEKFAKLFSLNFGILSLLLMSGFVRLITGILRDKPVTIIAIAVVALTLLIIYFLNRLTKVVCTNTIPDLYKKVILTSKEIRGNLQWNYFLLGAAALTPSFVPLVNYVDKNNSGSSCGTSCGSSCGSSCSSCGGCGGD